MGEKKNTFSNVLYSLGILMLFVGNLLFITNVKSIDEAYIIAAISMGIVIILTLILEIIIKGNGVLKYLRIFTSLYIPITFFAIMSEFKWYSLFDVFEAESMSMLAVVMFVTTLINGAFYILLGSKSNRTLMLVSLVITLIAAVRGFNIDLEEIHIALMLLPIIYTIRVLMKKGTNKEFKVIATGIFAVGVVLLMQSLYDANIFDAISFIISVIIIFIRFNKATINRSGLLALAIMYTIYGTIEIFYGLGIEMTIFIPIVMILLQVLYKKGMVSEKTRNYCSYIAIPFILLEFILENNIIILGIFTLILLLAIGYIYIDNKKLAYLLGVVSLCAVLLRLAEYMETIYTPVIVSIIILAISIVKDYLFDNKEKLGDIIYLVVFVVGMIKIEVVSGALNFNIFMISLGIIGLSVLWCVWKSNNKYTLSLIMITPLMTCLTINQTFSNINEMIVECTVISLIVIGALVSIIRKKSGIANIIQVFCSYLVIDLFFYEESIFKMVVFILLLVVSAIFKKQNKKAQLYSAVPVIVTIVVYEFVQIDLDWNLKTLFLVVIFLTIALIFSFVKENEGVLSKSVSRIEVGALVAASITSILTFDIPSGFLVCIVTWICACVKKWNKNSVNLAIVIQFIVGYYQTILLLASKDFIKLTTIYLVVVPILIIVCCNKFINRGKESKALDIIASVIICILIVPISFNLEMEEIIALLILGSVLLIVSIILKNNTKSVLALILIVFSVIAIIKIVAIAIPGWIYLILAGILLVIIGIILDKKGKIK